MKCLEKRRLRKKDAGFAMVATLSMMVLLTVVVVGMLSLSTISLRKASVENPRLVAQANARLALMMAVGALQKNLGPDQRVSGDERLVSRGKGTPANPHWLSVWKTTREDGTPWIIRNGDAGGLADLRQDGGFDPETERMAVLVSGNESGIRYKGTDTLGDKEAALLVGPGSIGKDADKNDEVRAPLVKLQGQRGTEGSYAWWVGDLGARANVATRDATVSLTASKYHARTMTQDASWKAFGAEEIPDTVRPALVSEPQLEHFEKDFTNRHFHDFTVWSAGLPVNVRDGGWRRDLSAYLDSNGSIAAYTSDGVRLPGLSDQDLLVGPANAMEEELSANPGQADRFSRVAPKFGLLRKWAERSETASFGSFRTSSETGDVAALKTGGGNSMAIDITKRTKSHLMPVLVEGSLYYNLSYYAPPRPEQPGNPYSLRVHYYPRVVLWNPFNFPIQVPNSGIFLHINGSKSVEVTLRDGRKPVYRMYWGRGDGKTGGAVRGSMFFRMDGATIEPGESMVWSPASNTAYNESAFGSNRLSAAVGPSPLRGFYQDRRADNWPLFEVQTGRGGGGGLYNNVTPDVPVEWREMVPTKPAGNVQSVAYTQADDYFMSWKPLTSAAFDAGTFSSNPMGRFVSCAYQYGDEDEMPVEWTSSDPVPFMMTTLSNPSTSQIPDRRTRDGFRLRWFDETESNRIGAGSLANTPFLEESPIGNWNMRSSWSFRHPFENVSDVAPNFFGIYTRDLFDGEVDWSSMAPKAMNGKYLGDPFDQPSNAPQKRILFDVPRAGAEISSIGAFQHVGFSEFIWHPTYPLGNSLADPRVPIEHTEPDRGEGINRDKGGWNQDSIGYSTDGRSNTNGSVNTTNEDNWAYAARGYYQQAALDQTLVYDLSYELNHSLWDTYFLSSGTNSQKAAFLDDREAAPLPNGRMMPNPMAGKIETKDLTNFHRAASKLLVDGAFNVNSTSVPAWEALLLSGIDGVHGDKVAFPRFLESPSGEWSGKDARAGGAWAGQRVFERSEIRKLAEEIVREVETRGPFLSLADFVNRRLEDGELGKKGALQAAIDRAGLNAAFTDEWPLDNNQSLPDFKHIDHIVDPTRMEQTLKPDTTAWGGLGFLTQADVLQYLGSALSARSDTFRVRAYGEAMDRSGKVVAKAWCEAVVQRSPNYVDPTDSALKLPADLSTPNRNFGRKFEIVFFRWLQPGEI